MQWFVETYVSKLPHSHIQILDVGSLNVNGCYKPLFSAPRYSYTGIDIEEGPNVDIVLQSPYFWENIHTGTCDVVISGQAFEHSEFFWKTFEEMTRVLTHDGLLCLIAPRGFYEHRYPVDCYRFLTDGMLALARYTCLKPLHVHTNCAPRPHMTSWYSDKNADTMLIARKPYAGETRFPDFHTYTCVPGDHAVLRTGFFPYQRPHALFRLWATWKKKLAKYVFQGFHTAGAPCRYGSIN